MFVDRENLAIANKIFTNTKSTIIHADCLTNFLKNNVPEKFSIDFQLDGVLKHDPSEIIVKKLIRNMGKEFDYLKIVESSVISPATVDRHFKGDRYISLFLGYPHVDIMQKLDLIRRSAIDDIYCWSHQYSDRELLEYIKHFKLLSLAIEKNCQKFGLQFIDTSENWSVQIQTAYNFIVDRLTKSR